MEWVATNKRLLKYMNRALSEDGNRDTVVAARYVALNTKAKLVRGDIVIAAANGYATAREYSEILKRALPIACAIEYVHAASLIEDDMTDKSELRRSFPACHIRFGEDIAHNASQHLVQRAYEIIASERTLTDKQRVDIIIRASKAGREMTIGQDKDITQKGLETLEDVLKMYEQKTGALIGAAAVSGGIVGGAPLGDVILLNRIWRRCGVAYQIGDDLLDALGREENIGKPTNQDQGKLTVIQALGGNIDKVMALKKRFDDMVKGDVAKLNGEYTLLKEIIFKMGSKHQELISG
ncbi:MAG: polyprenyl synthetase family protein [Candidatus Pacearchaeota archaeon]|nr:polyprenyl synthetase family protein [Candidatus Pacearchaeota archaeon]